MKLQAANAFCMMDNEGKNTGKDPKGSQYYIIHVFPTLCTADSNICSATVQEETRSFLRWDKLVIFVSVPHC